MSKRIGILAGSFNPVHSGHIRFALQAIDAARLDSVCFLPERRPRTNNPMEYYAHRVSMLKHALRPYRKFAVLELIDNSFSLSLSLPKLLTLYPNDMLVLLMGFDVLAEATQPSYQSYLLSECGVAISLRQKDKLKVDELCRQYLVKPKELYLIDKTLEANSASVRDAIADNKTAAGLLDSVKRYCDRNWLYLSISRSVDISLNKL